MGCVVGVQQLLEPRPDAGGTCHQTDARNGRIRTGRGSTGAAALDDQRPGRSVSSPMRVSRTPRACRSTRRSRPRAAARHGEQQLVVVAPGEARLNGVVALRDETSAPPRGGSAARSRRRGRRRRSPRRSAGWRRPARRSGPCRRWPRGSGRGARRGAARGSGRRCRATQSASSGSSGRSEPWTPCCRSQPSPAAAAPIVPLTIERIAGPPAAARQDCAAAGPSR